MRIIAGTWRSRRIISPPGHEVRPTTDRVREAWMSALGSRVRGARVLDLFSGSGALGLEALSRGAASVVFVERAPDSIRVLRENIESLSAQAESKVVRGDVFTHLAQVGPCEFDVAFADPPYSGDAAVAVAERFLSEPFAHELWLEHRTGACVPEASDRRQRRYGKTTLSTYFGSCLTPSP